MSSTTRFRSSCSATIKRSWTATGTPFSREGARRRHAAGSSTGRCAVANRSRDPGRADAGQGPCPIEASDRRALEDGEAGHCGPREGLPVVSAWGLAGDCASVETGLVEGPGARDVAEHRFALLARPIIRVLARRLLQPAEPL